VFQTSDWEFIEYLTEEKDIFREVMMTVINKNSVIQTSIQSIFTLFSPIDKASRLRRQSSQRQSIQPISYI